MKISIGLTVLFEDPFWIGVFERNYDEKYEVSRIVFGSEPKDYDVYDFILKEFYNIKFTKPIFMDKKIDKKINPKRLQRKIKKQVENNGIETKAQLAIKLQYQENKVEGKKRSKEKKEEDQRRRFEMKQQKKKEKHKGH
ncbi:YjdF family protein [Inediibacterium massiliense]|uniref:YjdF family protein n=1 Tax=Inediibacterium massiliense TaxID=1658111 RepID=UPI0006B555CF|nr:YjdF family protein [Inediibacterium massiliense]